MLVTKHLSKNGGFTLLEVMIAVVIFSVGLLGTAALMVSSVKANNTAYLRSQANFLTANMADRMLANHLPVWDSPNPFVGTFPGGGTPPVCDATNACTPAQLAARDAEQWGVMVAALLPNGQGTVACVIGAAPPGGVGATGRPAPNGPCTIAVSWSEQDENAVTGSITQTVTLNFQP